MTITCQPMDATAGAPTYSAQNERQNMAPFYGGGGGVALAARSGFRVGTPSNILTATSTTWTLGPCSAVISPNSATAQGSYRWATDTNQTGAVRAANATYARKDIVYIQVNDSSSGDGSGALTAPVSYAYGPEDGTNVPPALPSRSILVGTLSVPIAGGGAPTVVLNPSVFVAAGGILPVPDQTTRDALTPYLSLTVDRADTGHYERYNGTAWRVAVATRLGLNRQAAVTTATATYATICTVTATHTGGPAEITYTGVLVNGNSGANRTADVQILRDGTAVSGITYNLPYIAGVNVPTAVVFMFDATAAAGAHTWELQTRGSAAGAVINQEMTMRITEQPA